MLLKLWTALRGLWKWEWALDYIEIKSNVLSFMTHCVWTVWKVASLRGLWDRARRLWCLFLFHNDWTQLLSSHSLDLSSSESDWNNLPETRTTGVHPTMKICLSLFTHHRLFISCCQASKMKEKMHHIKNIPFDFSFKIHIIDLCEKIKGCFSI